MGVHLLKRLLEDGKHIKRNVSIEKLIGEYRTSYGQNPLVLIDCRSVWGYAFKSCNLFDCSWTEIYETIRSLISQFQKLGCDVEAYTGGSANDWHKKKKSNWRLTKTASVYEAIMHNDLNSLNSEIATINGEFYLFNRLARIVFSSLCKVRSSLAESETSIMAYALEQNVFAILAEDTDLLVYKSAKYYFPLSKVNFVQKMVDLYDTESLCQQLNINPEHFPFFCSCMGNEHISSNLLKVNQKQNVIARVLSINKNKTLNQLMQNVNELSYQIFHKENLGTPLRRSVNMYTNVTTHAEPKSPVLDSYWNAVVGYSMDLVADDKCVPCWYVLLKHRQFTGKLTFEDYNNNDLVDNAALFRPLRARVYGYAFFECKDTICITEYCPMGGPVYKDVIVDPVRPNVDFPGLLQLWDKTNVLQETRWRIFSDIVSSKMDHMQLSEIPEDMVVQAAILYYMKKELKGRDGDSYIADWEIVCMLYHYSLAESLNLTNCVTGWNTRALTLFFTFMNAHHSMLFVLHASGFPVDLKFAVPMKYNAKIFNDVYVRVQKNKELLMKHVPASSRQLVEFLI